MTDPTELDRAERILLILAVRTMLAALPPAVSDEVRRALQIAVAPAGESNVRQVPAMRSAATSLLDRLGLGN